MKFVCKSCNRFVFDEDEGDKRAELTPGTGLEDIPRQWRCPVCGHWKGDLKEINDSDFAEKRAKYMTLFPAPKGEAEKTKKDLPYYRDIARLQLVKICAVNKVCDGNPDRLCMGMKYGRPIGFGGAGQGRTWDANFKALARHKLRMRVVKENHEPEMATTFLRKKIMMPVMVSSVSGTRISMNNALSEEEFQRGMIEGAKLFGTIGLSGNTVDAPDHPGIEIIGENDG